MHGLLGFVSMPVLPKGLFGGLLPLYKNRHGYEPPRPMTLCGIKSKSIVNGMSMVVLEVSE